MTAITLNLLAEEQFAQEQRARDPFKVAIAIGVGLVALVAALGGIATILSSHKKSEVSALQEQLNRLNTPELQEQEAEFTALETAAKEIARANHTRSLYAPSLAQIKDLTADNVQLNRLVFSVATETVQPAVDAAAEQGKESDKSRVARPKVVERLTLRLDGKAAGSRPELDVNAFIQTLRKNSAFSADIEDIQLRSIARGPTDPQQGATALPSAYFVIECLFKERK